MPHGTRNQPYGAQNHRYIEIPTDLLLDVHELVIGCNSDLKVDGWEGTVIVTMNSDVMRFLEPLTKWLEYAAAKLSREVDQDPETLRRLSQLRHAAKKPEGS